VTGFSELLSVGDLRSDGLANEVARIVSANPTLLGELVDALRSDDPSVRGHAADALEKVARAHPKHLVPFLAPMIRQAHQDKVPMLRWHLAMLLGHVSVIPATIPAAKRALLTLLHDVSPFVRSWAITSLAIIARRAPRSAGSIARGIAPLASDRSAAVAKRAQTALRVLTDPRVRLPRSWVKGQALSDR
jgi:HEAT repeat protein